jgi:hypothetical protein
MSQPGRRTAAQIKRRIIQACQEAGLTVQGAKYYIRHDCDDRLVQVAAVTHGGSRRNSAIDIRTAVRLDGNWSGCVEIACLAADDCQGMDAFMRPVFILEGREFVALHELAEQLRQTIQEGEQVTAAIRLGVEGPYRFERTCWEMYSPATDNSPS